MLDTMKKFYCHPLPDGQLKMSPEQAAQRKLYLSSFKLDDVIEETLQKYRQPRSHKQLGAWFGLFSKTVLAEFDDRGWDTSYIFNLENPTGIEITTDLLKQYMYAKCPAFDDNGNQITMRNMNTLKMAKWFDDCRNFASSQWSIYVPNPDPKWKDKKELAE